MSTASVKKDADLRAKLSAAHCSNLVPFGVAENFKFYRRLVGLRGSDLDPKQDDRYDAAGKRRAKASP